MANTPMSIADSAIKIFNPDALYVTPFELGTDGKTYQRGSTTYKLTEVIRDTTTISQDDPEEQTIDNEFGSAPILKNVTLGSYQFSAEVADMQPTLLEKLCGYVKGKSKTDRIYAPASYTPIYAEIVLTFKLSDSQVVGAVLPKVQLNSKATFDSLSSNMGRLTLAGTGLNLEISDGTENPTITTPFYVDTNWTAASDL
jgi:hypothetical protein